jgi:hypothetical protein
MLRIWRDGYRIQSASGPLPKPDPTEANRTEPNRTEPSNPKLTQVLYYSPVQVKEMFWFVLHRREAVASNLFSPAMPGRN